MTRGQLRDTNQFLLGACGQPSGSTEPGINLARKAVLSNFCALVHISKTGWGAVIRVEIVFLTLKIILVCHFTGLVDVIELREAQRVSQSIVLLKLRKTVLVKVLLRNISAVENARVDVKADLRRPFKRKLFLITQS